MKSFVKFVLYIGFVVLAVYYTPKLLSRALETDYPMATITSGSMWPALKENDLILIKGLDGKDAEVGQIIVFQNSAGFTIHRVIRRSDDSIVTKGDANNTEDEPIENSEVIGRTVYVGDNPFRIPKLGLVSKLFSSVK